MNDPHEQKRVTRDHYCQKTEVRGRIVTVLDWAVDDRGLALIPQMSRAVRRGEILELVATDEEAVEPGGTVDKVAYLGFMEVNEGGIVLIGDTIAIDKNDIGEVIGFDETHAPNHLNVVIRMTDLKTGREAEIPLNTLVIFSEIIEETEKQIGF